ncbi:MAG: hypothetical protein HY876_04770 [Coriobacteriales bacterium]|nr:hypothetical protein [Coriobacteriales bacterium]
MAKCWEMRGCDEEMQAECPHSAVIGDRCPTKCAFETCSRETYELTNEPAEIWDPTVDRSHAIREGCLFCTFFLTHAPKL